MRVGSLFSGIGGFDLGLEWAGMEISWQVEKDSYCLKVLEKHWPDVPKFGDIKELDRDGFRGLKDLGPVDLICGGPPCQPASLAGKRKGAEDDRWLWPETLRAVAAIRPSWCLFENPVGLRTMGLDGVLSRLEGFGYQVWPVVIPTCAVGTIHRRDRIWILAYSNGEFSGITQKRYPSFSMPIGLDAKKVWGRGRESYILGENYGVPNRVDRLRALGNAVVPQVVYEIGRAIMEAGA